MNKLIMGILFGIVTIVVLFSFIGRTSGTLALAGDSVSSANNCSAFAVDTAGQRLFMDISVSTTNCTNSTGNYTNNVPTFYTLPLRGLFGRSAILMVIVMAAFLLLMIALSFKMVKRK